MKAIWRGLRALPQPDEPPTRPYFPTQKGPDQSPDGHGKEYGGGWRLFRGLWNLVLALRVSLGTGYGLDVKCSLTSSYVETWCPAGGVIGDD